MTNTKWQKGVFGIVVEDGFVQLRIGPPRPIAGKTLPRADLALPPADARALAQKLIDAAKRAEEQEKPRQ